MTAGEQRAWWLVGLLSATATASYLCRVNLSVAGVLLMKEFGLSQIEMGRVFSAFLLGYALFQIPGGMLADRFGARRVLVVSAFWWAGGTALLTAIGGGAYAVAFLLTMRFLIGVGEAPTFPAAAQAVSRWVPAPRQGHANGFVIAAIGVGSAVAPPLISAAMIRWGWRAALLVSAAPALAMALIWLAVRTPETPREAAGESRPLPRSPAFILLTISYTLQGYVGYIFVFWFYLYLVEVRHFDLLRGALLGSLPWILSIVSIPLGGWISDRLPGGRRIVPFAGMTGSSVFLALGAHTSNPWFAAVCLAVSTALVVSVEGPFWATMIELAGGRSGAAGGVMNMGSNLGGLISPALTPVLAAAIGWENALHLAAALAALAGFAWIGIKPRPRSAAA